MAVLMVTLIKDTALKSFDQNINISADIKLILFIFLF